MILRPTSHQELLSLVEVMISIMKTLISLSMARENKLICLCNISPYHTLLM